MSTRRPGRQPTTVSSQQCETREILKSVKSVRPVEFLLWVEGRRVAENRFEDTPEQTPIIVSRDTGRLTALQSFQLPPEIDSWAWGLGRSRYWTGGSLFFFRDFSRNRECRVVIIKVFRS